LIVPLIELSDTIKALFCDSRASASAGTTFLKALYSSAKEAERTLALLWLIIECLPLLIVTPKTFVSLLKVHSYSPAEAQRHLVVNSVEGTTTEFNMVCKAAMSSGILRIARVEAAWIVSGGGRCTYMFK
jgi:hypothetical protein